MTHHGTVRTAIKRATLLTAANWQVVVIQAVADSIFKLLVAIPIIGGAFFVALLLGEDLADMLRGDLRHTATFLASALAGRPGALMGFGTALAVVVLGGSILTFLVKGGSVSTILAADRVAGTVERPPLRLAYFQRAMQFSIEGFSAGASGLFPRYLGLGLILILVYTLSVGLYLAAAVVTYARAVGAGPLAGWTALMTVLFLVLALWITLVNLIYLFAQIIMALSSRGPLAAIGQAVRFARAERRKVARAFGAVLLLLVLATGLSLMAIAGLGLIAFVPVAGLAVLPIQLGAAFFRSILFQWLGLTALGTYLTLYRRWATPEGGGPESAPSPLSFIDEQQS